LKQSNQPNQKIKVTKPHWSLVTNFWVAAGIIALSATAVLLLMHKAVWVELEVLALIVGVMMTAFYTYVLYLG